MLYDIVGSDAMLHYYILTLEIAYFMARNKGLIGETKFQKKKKVMMSEHHHFSKSYLKSVASSWQDVLWFTSNQHDDYIKLYFSKS